MFFFFSKLLFFIIQPINWVIVLMAYALFSKKPKRKRKALIGAIVLSLFFTNHFIYNLVIRAWEPESLRMDDIEDTYDIGILLGGYSSLEIAPDDGRHRFSMGANRFTQAYELYKMGRIKKLLLSGGSGKLLGEEKSEAILMERFLLKIGFPEEDIIIEPDSRNTYENALYSSKIIKNTYPNASCLLLTSASHMPRASGCFKKVGLDFTPFCVDYLSERIKLEPSDIRPDPIGFYRWELLIKEWVGLLAYKVRGYI